MFDAKRHRGTYKFNTGYPDRDTSSPTSSTGSRSSGPASPLSSSFGSTGTGVKYRTVISLQPGSNNTHTGSNLSDARLHGDAATSKAYSRNASLTNGSGKQIPTAKMTDINSNHYTSKSLEPKVKVNGLEASLNNLLALSNSESGSFSNGTHTRTSSESTTTSSCASELQDVGKEITLPSKPTRNGLMSPSNTIENGLTSPSKTIKNGGMSSTTGLSPRGRRQAVLVRPAGGSPLLSRPQSSLQHSPTADGVINSLNEEPEHPFFAVMNPAEPAQIVSAKGTVRGVRNRVKAGIAVFVDKHSHGKQQPDYRSAEKGKIVLYTTSVMVVRDTYDKCLRVKKMLQTHGVQYEEKDVFLSRDNQKELMTRLDNEHVELPQVFADGCYLGGADEMDQLNENRTLHKIFKHFKKAKVTSSCMKCGGYRYTPCASCHGSKKSQYRNHFTEEFCALRCTVCDNNGLVRCHLCDDDTQSKQLSKQGPDMTGHSEFKNSVQPNDRTKTKEQILSNGSEHQVSTF